MGERRAIDCQHILSGIGRTCGYCGVVGTREEWLFDTALGYNGYPHAFLCTKCLNGYHDDKINQRQIKKIEPKYYGERKRGTKTKTRRKNQRTQPVRG